MSLVLTAQVQADAARYLYSLSYPESGKELLDPGSINCDPHTGEIFVTDTRNQRVVIFDRQGRYSFDFNDPEHLTGLRQTVVDSLGRIYVLRGPEAVISVFDYNGEYLNDLSLTGPGAEQPLDVSSIVMDGHDRLYALTVMPAHMYVFTMNGEWIRDFALFAEADSAERYQPGYGAMALVGDKLFIPVPVFAEIGCFTIEGKFISTFGLSGGGPGELSLPVAVAGDPNGKVWVLDKHRHTLLQYDDKGRFVREVGGRGKSPGWFFHPTSLVFNRQGEAIVGQSYLGRVQSVDLAGKKIDINAYTAADAAATKK